MIIEPKVRGFICTTAHPEGCRESVQRQIEYVKRHEIKKGPKKVLIIGASTGYGLASRIAVTYTYGASTLGVMYEKPASDRRTATPGFYNTKAFEEQAQKDGYYAATINGDAFSKEIKEQTIQQIKKELGKVDLVIYSLAAPRRTTNDQKTYSSVLKTTGETFTNRSLDLRTNELTKVTIEPATKEEEEATVKVMGGEDWMDWMLCLQKADVLEKNVKTVAYSYIGPELTYPIYYQGTIGLAKQHLYETSLDLMKVLEPLAGSAFISVNKALVTQASSAIPIVPLYISVLYKIMKAKGIHEGCIEQMDRLYAECLTKDEIPTDELGRIRMDDYEMREDVQAEVAKCWNEINEENLKQYADIDGYWEDFYHMFGFHYDNVDYTKEVEL